MNIKAGDVIGLKVITLNEGKEIERVRDVVYDPKQNKVRALVVDEGGWFSDARVILLEDIQDIGSDAVVIINEEMIKRAEDVSSKVASIARDDTNLTKTKMVTETGNELGSVSDIIFDSKTGMVEQFVLSQGGLKNVQSGMKTIRVDQVMTVGEDVTVVRASAEDEVENQARERGVQGAIYKGVDTARSRIPDIVENVKTKANEAVKATENRYEEVRTDPKTQNIMETTRERVARVLDDLEREAKKAEDRISRMLRDTGSREDRMVVDREERLSGAKGGEAEKTVVQEKEKRVIRKKR